ncbi:metal ABC transporter substrate-binding protein [Vagococcus vulneris]|uniref:Zinc ABC transporter substrate-binding protein n=1 Tax=Vagococcus vulneris TaxID=1977869 RepID=A0A429ZWW9_9ENTE|nr:metal ABC transporter substrate-binding protein [Vagococcus vulneris]RST98304.1 zinc ABC transporter substrate-binding protein [Vagococcus vulneris]
MKRLKYIVTALILLVVMSACSSNKESRETEKTSDKLKIVTTFYPMYDFTQNIVGDAGDVSMLIKQGVEPHDFEPSAKDMAKIQDADVFIYNSTEMETWVPDVLKGIDTSKVKVIEASKDIKLLEDRESHDEELEEHERGEHSHVYDPHVWTDPVLAKQEVETITKKLTEINNTHKSLIQKNGAEYAEKLTELEQAYQEAFKDAVNRKFVTQHQAFSYLAHQYDLVQIPISGINPDQEPTPKELKQIEDFVKKEKVSIIYTESSASSKVAATVSAATGAELKVLNPLESLSEKQQKSGDDYLSVMRKNLDMLKLSIK